MTEINCCLKCGGEGHLVCRSDAGTDSYTVDCEELECPNSTPEEHPNPESAIAQWNLLNRRCTILAFGYWEIKPLSEIRKQQ